jgi:hypothetical protein
LPLIRDDLFDDFFKAATLIAVIGQENLADAILSRIRKMNTQTFANVLEKSMRHLHQYARAVACVFFASTRAAMIKILENRQCLLDDLMRFFALDVYNESNSTSVVLEARIIKTLLGWQTGLAHVITLILPCVSVSK